MEITNEFGVIVRFAQEAEKGGFKFVQIGSTFPDAIVEKNGKQYRVEFEFSARNFAEHRHDIRECDIIVCWQNDYPDSVLPVVELSDPLWFDKELNVVDAKDKEIMYWKSRAILAEKRLRVAEVIGSKDAGKEQAKAYVRERQEQVLLLKTAGLSVDQMAGKLNVSAKTISRDLAALNGRMQLATSNGQL